MILSQLIKGVEYTSLVGDRDVEVTSLTYDSRAAEAGCCFFAVAGTAVDGHNFIASAIERGAQVVVCQRIPDEVKGADCT
ncbi:MAG: UDP-N-acetylmuramoyl-L-alanyl-D-glutamate--2,6-diaminopimelate ligase, partial [Alistipes sp.]|nr:UDP-N-acetylmuramoyl-L-alanyl-D-glutamate--2,6-diaminopimelate ligase [Alistipes sp.]